MTLRNVYHVYTKSILIIFNLHELNKDHKMYYRCTVHGILVASLLFNTLYEYTSLTVQHIYIIKKSQVRINQRVWTSSHENARYILQQTSSLTWFDDGISETNKIDI
jgi:hypothetical protein